jgi:hypothetical protein
MEYKRIELERLQVLWRNSEGPDEKVSRHLGRLATWGRTLLGWQYHNSLPAYTATSDVLKVQRTYLRIS